MSFRKEVGRIFDDSVFTVCKQPSCSDTEDCSECGQKRILSLINKKVEEIENPHYKSHTTLKFQGVKYEIFNEAIQAVKKALTDG